MKCKQRKARKEDARVQEYNLNPAYTNNATEEQREHVTSTSYLNITNRDQNTSPVSVDTNGDHMYDYPRFETQDDGMNEIDQDISQSAASDVYAN